jgi:hypothetical protein
MGSPGDLSSQGSRLAIRPKKLHKHLKPLHHTHAKTFLDLPGELRNLVYAEYFSRVTFIHFEFSNEYPVPGNRPFYEAEGPDGESISSIIIKSKKRAPVDKWETSHSAIHLTCRQLYHETQSFMYGSSEFSFCSPPSVFSFIQSTSSTGLRFITSLTVDVNIPSTLRPCFGVKLMTKLSKCMPRMKSFVLRVKVYEFPLIFTFARPWVQFCWLCS